ncbi:MAG: DsrE family protein [Chitinophagales bacterium]|nr:DsrE family protein [Chitinophagales bacterium]MDW8418523.1 DsrE family protein [Chitinophagales bacterium]
MKPFISLLFGLAITLHAASQKTSRLSSSGAGQYTDAAEPLKIIFQLTTADTQAHKALMKQLGNITSVEPATKIEVVCHGPGLDMLRKDKSTVADKIQEFTAKGIVFYACEFSMKERNVSAEQILPSAEFVKAGIVHIVRKQREGWSYIKSGF